MLAIVNLPLRFICIARCEKEKEKQKRKSLIYIEFILSKNPRRLFVFSGRSYLISNYLVTIYRDDFQLDVIYYSFACRSMEWSIPGSLQAPSIEQIEEEKPRSLFVPSND